MIALKMFTLNIRRFGLHSEWWHPNIFANVIVRDEHVTFGYR